MSDGVEAFLARGNSVRTNTRVVKENSQGKDASQGSHPIC